MFVQVVGYDYVYVVVYVVGLLQFMQVGIDDWYVGVVVLLVVQLCGVGCGLGKVVEMWVEVVGRCFWEVMQKVVGKVVLVELVQIVVDVGVGCGVVQVFQCMCDLLGCDFIKVQVW